MEPLIELAIEPRSAAGRDRLDAVLARMKAEDPSFAVSTDAESGQAVLKGWDEPYLDRKLAVLTDEHGLELWVGAPQVAYRETITRRAQIDYRHKKALANGGQFARVVLVFEPGARNSGFSFISTAHPAAVPALYVAGVAAGLEAARQLGLLAGFPVIDMKATLVDGAWHDIDSSAPVFDMAARMAFKALRDKGAPVLLEPVMRLKVSVPETCLMAVIGDLRAHRGVVEPHGDSVTGTIPLVSLLGYQRRLDRLTDARGEWSMIFDHYAPVPPTTPPDVFPPAIGMRA